MTPRARIAAAGLAIASYAAATACTAPPPTTTTHPGTHEHSPRPHHPSETDPTRGLDQALAAPPTTTRPTTPRAARQGTRTVHGGELPPESVKRCESGGKYDAENPTSSASGAWQILNSSWRTEDSDGDGRNDSYRGYSRASDAPPDVQDTRAAELWASGRGASHWKACL